MPRSLWGNFILYVKGYRDDFSIGECYQAGRHVEKDIDVALIYFRQAANDNNAKAYGKIGKIYEEKYKAEQVNNNQNYLLPALEAYLQGALRADPPSRESLKKYAEAGNVTAEFYFGVLCEDQKQWQEAQRWYEKASQKYDAEATYKLGCLYSEDRISSQDQKTVLIEKDISKELRYYREAAKGYCKYALDVLDRMSDSVPEAAIHIAQMYELGESLNQDIARAVIYLEKASQLGDKDASFHLGELHEEQKSSEDNTKAIKLNNQTACSYYLIATTQKHEQGLAKSEQLIDKLQDEKLEFELGEICQKELQDKLRALKWYKRSADKKFRSAKDRIQEIAHSDHDFAYAVAQTYEKNENSLSDRCTAYRYYAIAARQGHTAAKEHLTSIAQLNDADAQFALGYKYYHYKYTYFHLENHIEKAVYWCMQAAEQVHIEANKYLTQTHFKAGIHLDIASKYEHGNGVRKQIQRAVQFYKKADDAGDIRAAHCLGCIYQVNHPDLKQDIQLAINYFFKAAKEGNKPSFMPLEKLLEGSSDGQRLYELAEIYQKNNETHLSVKWYLRAIALNHRQARADVQSKVNSDSNFAYIVAQFYEKGEYVAKDISTAFICYAIAARQNHSTSKNYLKSEAKRENADAQYALGVEYYHHKNDIPNAVHWCMRAAEQGHTHADQYLTRSKFSIATYRLISTQYEQGNGVRRNMQRAVLFYSKADDLDDSEAAYRLGCIYQVDHPDLKQDLQKAITYHFKAAQEGHAQSLSVLDDLLDSTSNGQWLYNLAEIYQKMGKTHSAVKWYLRAIEQNHRQARSSVQKIAHVNPHFASVIAQFYEKGEGVTKNKPAALKYYAIAARQGDSASKNHLRSEAKAGDADAQYEFGYTYYHHKKDISNAVYWCMQATEQDHNQAIDYLTKTPFNNATYRMIASRYEEGNDGVGVHIQRAEYFYSKACDAGDKEAAYCLGQLYEAGDKEIEQDLDKAFEYYVLAHRRGHKDALVSLERLAEETDGQQQVKLANIYHSKGYAAKTSFWQSQANETKKAHTVSPSIPHRLVR